MDYSKFKKTNISKKKFSLSFDVYTNREFFSDKITVFVRVKNGLSTLIMNRKIATMAFLNVNHGIFIIKSIGTTCLKSTIVYQKFFKLEFFYEYEMLFNVTKHFLVPKHELISNTEKKKLLKNYNVRSSQLPKILLQDPLSRYYGANKGDIFKITRFNNSSGIYLTYRVCY